MQSSTRRVRITPSLVISILALVVSMSAGAYAVTIAPKNSVVSKSIKNGEVKTKDLANNAVNGKKIKDGQVGSAEVADGSITSTDIGDGQVGLGDLSAAAKTDLNDATTLGGLTIAQIVAASGGEYYEARQAPGSVDVEKVEADEVTLATLNLPHAGKYLVNTRAPMACFWDGSGTSPTNPDASQGNSLDNPWFWAQSRLKAGGTVLETANEGCDVNAGSSFVVNIFGTDFQFGTFLGSAMPTTTHLVTVSGPTTLTLTGSGNIPTAVSSIGERITAQATGAIIQAVTVQ